MKDYAGMLGAPDPSTTARMRARLEQYMQERRARRRRALGVGAVVSVAAAILLAVVVLGPERTPDSVVRAPDEPRALELGRARLDLRAGSELRTDAADDARAELLVGEVEITIPHEASFALQSGSYEVRVSSGRVVVRHTDGVPVVTVVRGEAELRGPGLPSSGIRVLESPRTVAVDPAEAS
jgi:ferric-dicitrate binding protein FerR (iron transport regulator)